MEKRKILLFNFTTLKISLSLLKLRKFIWGDDGNGAGWGWSEGWGLHPYPGWLCFTSSPPRMTGTVFLLDPRPLGPHKTLLYPVKLYFLLICPLLLQFFLIKSISLIKIYLKLQINLSHQIKIIFSKNWIILFKCLTIQYHNKNKNLIIQNQWSIVYKFFF